MLENTIRATVIFTKKRRGGIRGIVELEVLAAIERELGEQIPIATLVDLIVGTRLVNQLYQLVEWRLLYRKSTGGIIALGLGVKKLPAKELSEKFIYFCKSAFTPRGSSHIPVINTLAALHHGSKYETRPLEKILVDQYGEELLFGGKHESDNYTTKVAVVSTTGSGRETTVLGNYIRQEWDGCNCKLRDSSNYSGTIAYRSCALTTVCEMQCLTNSKDILTRIWNLAVGRRTFPLSDETAAH
jgi:hypothetical protein